MTRARAALNVARLKSRRSSSNNIDPLEKRAHPPLTRENLLTSSRRTSDEKDRPTLIGIPTKRKGETGGVGMISSIATLKPMKVDENSSNKVVEYKGPSVEELRRRADVERVKEMTGRMKERIMGIVVEYAEKGDAQLAATVCCIFQRREVAFEPEFVVRVTKAYLGSSAPSRYPSSTSTHPRSRRSSPSWSSSRRRRRSPQILRSRNSSYEISNERRLPHRLWTLWESARAITDGEMSTLFVPSDDLRNLVRLPIPFVRFYD